MGEEERTTCLQRWKVEGPVGRSLGLASLAGKIENGSVRETGDDGMSAAMTILYLFKKTNIINLNRGIFRFIVLDWFFMGRRGSDERRASSLDSTVEEGGSHSQGCSM